MNDKVVSLEDYKIKIRMMLKFYLWVMGWMRKQAKIIRGKRK